MDREKLINTATILGGIFLVFFGWSFLYSGDYITAISSFLGSLFFFPFTFSELNKKIFENKMDKKARLISGLGFFIFSLFFISPAESINTADIPPENNIVQTEENIENKDSQDETAVNENVDNEESNTQIGMVVSVTDGDTFRVKIGEEEFPVRMIGINTPEIHHQSEPVQCYGPEAQEALEKLILNKEVTLEKDVSETDKYDRLLRYVWIDEVMANEYMTQNGYAMASSYPPDTKYQERIKAGESSAKESKIGFWSPDICNGDVYTGTYKDPSLNVETNTNTTTTTTTNTTQEVKETTPVVPVVKTTPTPAPKAEPAPVQTSPYTCSCSKTCGQMASCEEAYYQLNTCGCSARDGDGDGIPCESLCR